MQFQKRAARWIIACFGYDIANNHAERNHRFCEEALELVQSLGMHKHEVLTLVDYVYDRARGNPEQEVGGVLNTLACLCEAHQIDMMEAGHIELDRCWLKLETIRKKQATKPKNSPLPQ